MRRQGERDIRGDIKAFSQKNKGGFGVMRAKLQEAYELCPAGLLQQLSQNTPCLNLYKADVFTPPTTPFGEYNTWNYLECVAFLASLHPEEFSPHCAAEQPTKKQKSTEEPSKMKEKAASRKDLSDLLDGLRDPTRWPKEFQNGWEIENVLTKEMKDEKAENPERLSYVVSRLISGVFSDFFYKALSSSMSLRHIKSRETSNCRLVCIEKIVETLEKLPNLGRSSRVKAPEFEGIKSQKLYTGALLLVIAILTMESDFARLEKFFNHMNKSLSIIFSTLCTIHRQCLSVRPWCFAIICLILSKAQNIPSDAVLPLAEYCCTEMREGNLLIPYLQRFSFLEDSLSQNIRKRLDKETTDEMLSEGYMTELLNCVQKPLGFLNGYYSLQNHPFFLEVARKLNERCSKASTDEIIRLTNSVRLHFLDKLNVETKLEYFVAKHFYDCCFRCILQFATGPKANEAIYDLQKKAIDQFGTYSLPAAKVLLWEAQEHENATDLIDQKIAELILQFEDAKSERYISEDCAPDPHDFTIDSTDDESIDPDDESNKLSSFGIQAPGQAYPSRTDKSSFAFFMRSHILKMMHKLAFVKFVGSDIVVKDETIDRVVKFYLNCVISSHASESDDNSDSSQEEIIRVHRLTCMNNLTTLVYHDTTSVYGKKRVKGLNRQDMISSWKAHRAQRIERLVRNVLLDSSITSRVAKHTKEYEKLLGVAISQTGLSENFRDTCLLLALHCLWDEFTEVKRPNSLLPAFIDEILKKADGNSLSSGRFSHEFHVAFQNMFASVASQSPKTPLSDAMISTMEDFCRENFTWNDAFAENFFPRIAKGHFPMEKQKTIMESVKIEANDLYRGMKEHEATWVNQYILQLLSVVFSLLSAAEQMTMLHRWLGYLYLITTTRPVDNTTDHLRRAYMKIFLGEKLHNKLRHFVPLSGAKVYTDEKLESPMDLNIEAQWVAIVGVCHTVLAAYTKYPLLLRWVKEVCASVLRVIRVDIVPSGKPAKKGADRARVSPLVEAFQKTTVGLITTPDISFEGKKHALEYLKSNPLFSATFISPRVIRFIGEFFDPSAQSGSKGKFHFQCVKLALETIIGVIEYGRKISQASPQEMCQSLDGLIELFSEKNTEQFHLLCTKKFLEDSGPALFRLLSLVKRFDEKKAPACIALHSRVVAYVEKNKVDVKPQAMRLFQNYMRN